MCSPAWRWCYWSGRRIFARRRAAAVKDADVADALHQFAQWCGAPAPPRRHRGSRSPIRALTLTSSWSSERALELAHHALGEPGITEHHQRVQRVGQAPQVFFLLLRKLHRGIIVERATRRETWSSDPRAVPVGSPSMRAMSSSNARSAKGWRSRAVFKLAEIQQAERLLRPGMRCVDLGAAPGGWSQYAARIIGGHRAASSRPIFCPWMRFRAWISCRATFATRRVRAGVDGHRRLQSRPCFVRYGPQHGRHRCGGSAQIHASGRAGARVRRPRVGPGRRCAGEVVSRRRFRRADPRGPAPLWASRDEKAKGVTNAQS